MQNELLVSKLSQLNPTKTQHAQQADESSIKLDTFAIKQIV